jgi:Serpin (serine protease inhibitor)
MIFYSFLQTDCSGTSNMERDGEMFFQVSPAIRQRRLIPIPAAVYRSGFTAGYDPILDATAVAFGDDLQSTIMVMPGQQGSSVPGDNLERLENSFIDPANGAFERLLTTFMERPGLEVQIPRFSHRSLINTTFALQQMGLKDIFDANKADLRGLTGAKSNDLYFSDLMQINQFSTCGEDKIADTHHIEIYPSPSLKRDLVEGEEEDDGRLEISSPDKKSMQYKSLFFDPIYDSRYMNVPLPLRPRQARLPENPRLRFDRPFLYFVRHNPTGIILFMGRFNPRLLP